MTSVAEVVELIVRAACRFLSDEVSCGEELYSVVGLRQEGKATKNTILVGGWTGAGQGGLYVSTAMAVRMWSHEVGLKLEVPDAKRYID